MYDIEAVCLRYFNVYGPNQHFDAYGNVIPIFVFRMLRNEPLLIFGDGDQTRDFVYVDDVVQANIKAGDSVAVSGAFNIASGSRVTINRLVEMIVKQNHLVKIEHGPERPGDVRHSLADISLAHQKINYVPSVDLEAGISDYVQWANNYLKCNL